mmetsp:Transcript_56596/g.184042  ORF Transcript_56596/g.184042 Transcript_56596/m.184042 type:complete len:233 (+) Transcript_56596:340-1038(+)
MVPPGTPVVGLKAKKLAVSVDSTFIFLGSAGCDNFSLCALKPRCRSKWRDSSGRDCGRDRYARRIAGISSLPFFWALNLGFHGGLAKPVVGLDAPCPSPTPLGPPGEGRWGTKRLKMGCGEVCNHLKYSCRLTLARPATSKCPHSTWNSASDGLWPKKNLKISLNSPSSMRPSLSRSKSAKTKLAISTDPCSCRKAKVNAWNSSKLKAVSRFRSAFRRQRWIMLFIFISDLS